MIDFDDFSDFGFVTHSDERREREREREFFFFGKVYYVNWTSVSFVNFALTEGRLFLRVVVVGPSTGAGA